SLFCSSFFLLMFLIYSKSSAAHRHLHSFPTRRSSDLGGNGSRIGRRIASHRCAEQTLAAAVEKHLGPGQFVVGDPQRQLELAAGDRKSTRLNSSHVKISYAVFCLKKKTVIRLLIRNHT